MLKSHEFRKSAKTPISRNFATKIAIFAYAFSPKTQSSWPKISNCSSWMTYTLFSIYIFSGCHEPIFRRYIQEENRKKTFALRIEILL